MSSSSDRGYAILLSHLHDTSSKLPFPTIQGALAHHLATTTPLPTPLAATAISSPFYLSQPFTIEKLQSLSTAFRHATHMKYRSLAKAAKSRSKLQTILGRSTQTIMGQWVDDVLRGVQGGHSVLRLAACGGLILGVEDIKVGEKPEERDGVDVGNVRSGVEDEIVVALAEVMDTYSSAFGSGLSSSAVEEWEREFQPAGQDILSLALILASQSLPLVAQHRLEALPLPALARLLTSTIASAFKYGTFLSSVSASVSLSHDKHVHISPSSPLAQTLDSMSSSPLTISIPAISRLTANLLAILLDSPQSSGIADNLYTVSDSLDLLREMAKTLERDWISCPLASITDLETALDSKDFTKSIWTMLKTFLFTNIMLAEAVLSAALYIPPQTGEITPATLALQTLHTLSHLSFVISQFGGVTTTTQGFEHLKKTFYLALDILSQSETHLAGGGGSKAEAYVQQACFLLNSQRAESATTPPRQAKQAFVLASIEQLIPVLSDKCVRDWVWGVCYPHLNDPSQRETYESAHSVILAIFASYAQRQQHLFTGSHSADECAAASSDKKSSIPPGHSIKAKYLNDHYATRVLSGVLNAGFSSRNNGGSEGDAISRKFKSSEDLFVSTKFVERMVPFYSKCLIDNSTEGKLNTSQLCLAYSALVRSASVSAYSNSSDEFSSTDDTYALAWYCIQLLLDTIHELSPPAINDQKRKGKARAKTEEAEDMERLHRLHLMLISTISSLPLPLMLRVLDHIRSLVSLSPSSTSASTSSRAEVDGVAVNGNTATDAAAARKKTELLEALFSELLEKTGDREKEAAIQWWYKYRRTLVPGVAEEKEGRDAFLSPWVGYRRKEQAGTGLEGNAGEGHENRSNAGVLSRL